MVGRTDATTGQAIAAFVILRAGNEPSEALVSELRDHVANTIGPIAKPKTILFTEDLPEDPLGQDHAPAAAQRGEDEQLGDTTTLADPTVVEGIKSRYLAPRPPTRSREASRARSRSTGPGATGRSSPGPAAVIDLDGVLSDAVSRQHYLESPRRDWRALLRRLR